MIYMIKNEFTEEDIQVLNYERYHHLHPHVLSQEVRQQDADPNLPCLTPVRTNR